MKIKYMIVVPVLILLAVGVVLALAGCTIGKDRVIDKSHTNAAVYDTTNTQAEADRCTSQHGTFRIQAGNHKKGTCSFPERWTIEHGKKGGPVDSTNVSHQVYDSYKIGDEWKG